MTTQKSILVTGSSSGLGYSISQTLARQGHMVWATMRETTGKNKAAAESLEAWAQAENLTLQVVELDVCDEASVQSAVQMIIDQAGAIDIVVNNAGVIVIGLAEAMTMTQIQHMFNVNVFGPLRLAQAVLPHWRERQTGYAIYISSFAGSIIYPFMGIYGATKSALNAMAETFYYDTYSLGIDTTIIQAGAYATDLGHNVQVGTNIDATKNYGNAVAMSEGFAQNFEKFLVPGVAGDPQEVADLVGSLVNLPSGQRPLYQPIGASSEGVSAINEIHLAVQQQVVTGMGMGALLNR